MTTPLPQATTQVTTPRRLWPQFCCFKKGAGTSYSRWRGFMQKSVFWMRHLRDPATYGRSMQGKCVSCVLIRVSWHPWPCLTIFEPSLLPAGARCGKRCHHGWATRSGWGQYASWHPTIFWNIFSCFPHCTDWCFVAWLSFGGQANTSTNTIVIVTMIMIVRMPTHTHTHAHIS